MIAFPDITPDIFTLNLFGMEFALRWYSVSYLMGFIIGFITMRTFVRRQNLWSFQTSPMEENQVESLTTYLIVAVILGGRLGYVLFYNFDYYLQNLVDIFRVWDGGMSFHGGFLGVVIAAIFVCFTL